MSTDLESPHRHRYGLMPVWTADNSRIDSWWWCTDHPTGEWVRIEDDPNAAEAIPSASRSGEEALAAENERLRERLDYLLEQRREIERLWDIDRRSLARLSALGDATTTEGI